MLKLTFMCSEFNVFKSRNMATTVRHGQTVSTNALYSGGPAFEYRPGDRLSFLRFFVFSQFLQENAGIVGLPQIGPLPLPSTSFTKNYSLIILYHSASKLLTASLINQK
jgi:hypothetical protein